MPEQNDELPFRMSPPADMDEPPPLEPARIAGPAYGVITVASLAIFLNCFGGYVLRNYVLEKRPPAGINASYAELGREAAPFLEACVTVLVYPLAVGGGIQMLRQRSYGLAFTSALLVMMPCSLMFPIGLAVGIWAVVVLRDSRVKELFK